MALSRRSVTLVLCALLHGFTHVYPMVLVPLYLQLQREFSLAGVAQATLLVSVQGIAYCVASFPAGILADRVSRKLLLSAGLAVNALAFLGLARTQSYGAAMAYLLLAGLAGSFYHPAAGALVVKLFADRPGQALGIGGIGSACGFFFGPLYGGWRGQMAGWRAPCWELGWAGLVAAAMFALLAQDAPVELGNRKEPRPWLPSLRFVVLFGLLALVFSLRDLGALGVHSLTSLFLQRAHGYREAVVGLYLGLTSLTGVVANPMFGVLSDNPYRLRWAAGLLGTAGFAAAAIPWMPARGVLPALMTYGFCLFATYPVLEAALAESVPDELRGRLFGLFIAVGGIIGNLSPWLAGLITDFLGPRAITPLAYVPSFALLGATIATASSGLFLLRWARRVNAGEINLMRS